MHRACARQPTSVSGVIYKWELQIDDRLVEHEGGGSLTISDTIFSIEAALDGVGLAYTFESLALPNLQNKRLKRVLTEFSPTFPGFYLGCASKVSSSTTRRSKS